MQLISYKDFEFNTEWFDDLVLNNDWCEKSSLFKREFEALESQILPEESFSKALNDVRYFKDNEGLFHIVFLKENLPLSIAHKFPNHYVFQAGFIDLRCARYSLQSPLRRIDNW
jgi:hypothetical protein